MNAAAAPWKPIRLLGKHAWASLLGSLVMALATTGAVDAYWSASGTGTGSGPVGTLAAATLSGTAGAGTATLTWTAVTPPGSGTVSYYVQRNGANPAGNCPTSSTASSVLICTDSGLSAGTYSYTVTGVWRTWTATSSTTLVNLASGALHHFLLAVATTTPIAGQADNLTITAKDAAGITVPAYSGSHSLTFSGASSIGAFTPKVTNSGGMATNFGAATAINFTNGVAAVSTGSNGAMTLYKAETVTVSVTDTSISGTSASITVSAAAANRLSFNQSPGNTVAGVAFASQPQVTVQDQYGNTVTTDTSNVTIAVMGGTAAVTGCANTKAASSGVATFSGCTITTAGTYTLTATDGSLTSAVSGSFTISAAAANKLSFNQSPGNTATGVPFAPQPQVTVQDQYGNTVTGDASTVTLTIKSGTPTTGGPGSLTGCSQSESSGVITFSGCTIATVGTGYKLTATDGSLTAADSTAFNITPAAAYRLSFNQSPGNTVAGVAFAPQPQVTVQDQYGNTVTTDTSNVTIAVMGGTAAVTGCANTKAASSGVATFSGCTITTAGTYTLTATDGLLISAVSTSFTISPAAASQLAFTTQPGGGTSSTAWATQPTVTVQDAYGNTVTAATASIALAITTPGGAILACTANPKDAAAGVDAFAGCRIDKAGTYTLIATAAGLTGAGSSAFNITVGTATKLAFTAQPGGGANSTVWTNQPTVTVQDAGGNTVTTATTSITVTITTPAGAILTCTPNPKAAVLGVDAFAGCRINKAGTYTLTATSGGYTSAVSNSFIISATVTFSSGPTLAANGYLPTHVSGSGFSGSVTITWSYAWGGYIYSTTTPADGSGNFTWDNYENCIDGYGVYQTTDQTVIVNATDSTHTAIGTGTLLCSLRPRHP